jgi:DNA-binding protein H-NS
MNQINELVAKRTELDAQIEAHRKAAVQQVLEYMAVLGVTLEDLNRGRHTGAKRPVKYRDESGNTWTGVGQRPRWLRTRILAGAALEDFSVRR